MTRRIMIQGTMSGAGKSLLCAALCRIFKQDGLRPAPFKSQNMALNSFVTADGLEMGRAQVLQAQAAGAEPDVRMNPVLLKPCSDTGSQIVVNGTVRGQMAAKEYFRYKTELIPDILAAYESLTAEYDPIVIEGAGSPAEINLRENDIVNMGLAELVDAPVLLVGDIDPGGVFAQLYGTVALLKPEERARVKGLIVNKFRGDVEILKPGLGMLEELTGLPVLGVAPWLRLDLDEEDSMAPSLRQKAAHKAVDIAVIRLPRISNFTDFSPLDSHPMLGVRYVDRPEGLGQPDMLVLPGTKSTVGDLLWLRKTGLADAIISLAGSGTPVLGVCGGYQMLGRTLTDPDGTEGGGPGPVQGLGLLPVDTVFGPEKTRVRVRGVTLAGPVAGARVEGYEIHTGNTTADGPAFCRLDDGRMDGCVRGSVCGTYLHGLFDTGEAVQALARTLCRRKGVAYADHGYDDRAERLDGQLDTLAEAVRRALDMDAVYRILEGTA